MFRIEVRAEHPADRQAIDVIHLSAFGGDAEAQFVAAARDSEDFVPELSLVAEYRGRLVGHLMLSRIALAGAQSSVRVLALAPMAVVPSQAYRGIGGELLSYACEKSRALGYGAIVEIGQTDYYLRHDFKPLSELGLHHSLSLGDELVTVRELEPGALPRGAELRFPALFDSLFRMEAW